MTKKEDMREKLVFDDDTDDSDVDLETFRYEKVNASMINIVEWNKSFNMLHSVILRIVKEVLSKVAKTGLTVCSVDLFPCYND